MKTLRKNINELTELDFYEVFDEASAGRLVL